MSLRSEIPKKRPERNEGIGKPRISGSEPGIIRGILAFHAIDRGHDGNSIFLLERVGVECSTESGLILDSPPLSMAKLSI